MDPGEGLEKWFGTKRSAESSEICFWAGVARTVLAILFAILLGRCGRAARLGRRALQSQMGDQDKERARQASPLRQALKRTGLPDRSRTARGAKDLPLQGLEMTGQDVAGASILLLPCRGNIL